MIKNCDNCEHYSSLNKKCRKYNTNVKDSKTDRKCWSIYGPIFIGGKTNANI